MSADPDPARRWTVDLYVTCPLCERDAHLDSGDPAEVRAAHRIVDRLLLDLPRAER